MMKKTLWKSLFWGSMVMTLLVLARCIATIARELYYGRQAWLDVILRDPWAYVGVAAAVVGIVTAVMWIVTHRKG